MKEKDELEIEIRELENKLNEFDVDVIIPVYKPDKKFNQLIERLTKQSIKPKHIFLLHTQETEMDSDQLEVKQRTEEALNYVQNFSTPSCQIVRLDIEKKDFDHGGTRNYGATLSDTEIVMFMTQDAVPVDKELIKNLLTPFHNENIAVTYGRQMAHHNSDVLEEYTRSFNYPDQSSTKSKEDLNELGIKTYFCSNVCAAYRKNVYDMLNGFVTKTIFNEDMIMAAGIIKEGYSIAYVAEAKVIHSHKYNYIQQFKRNFDLGVSQKQYKEIFSKLKSESEGMKMVSNTLSYLIDKKQFLEIPNLFLQSGFKYLGYLAGKNYELFPKNIIKKLSMNPTYWE